MSEFGRRVAEADHETLEPEDTVGLVTTNRAADDSVYEI